MNGLFNALRRTEDNTCQERMDLKKSASCRKEIRRWKRAVPDSVCILDGLVSLFVSKREGTNLYGRRMDLYRLAVSYDAYEQGGC